jgi:uncharacterized coiled-coil DUF342 family protein
VASSSEKSSVSEEDAEIQELLSQSAELARELRSALDRTKELRQEANRLREQIKTECGTSADGAVSS